MAKIKVFSNANDLGRSTNPRREGRGRGRSLRESPSRGGTELVAVLPLEVGLGLEVQVATADTVVHEVGVADRGVGASGVHSVLVERAVIEHDVHVGDVRVVPRAHEPLVLAPAALVVTVEGEQVGGAEVGDVFARGRGEGDRRAQPGVGLGHLRVVPPEAELVADVDRAADPHVGRAAPNHRKAVVEVIIVAHVARRLVARARPRRTAVPVLVRIAVPGDGGAVAIAGLAAVGRVRGIAAVRGLAGLAAVGRAGVLGGGVGRAGTGGTGAGERAIHAASRGDFGTGVGTVIDAASGDGENE